MPSLINSDDGVVSGSAGLKTTGSNDGILALQNNGTTNITVTAAGNVGIGTTSPSVLLDVYGTGSVLGEFIRNNTGSASGGVTIGNNSGTFTIFADTAFSIYDNQAAVSRAAITSTGLFQFNSGYGSVATAYGCRAWVNFNGAANTNLSGTYSQSGTTVTVTATAHGLLAGSVIYSDITSGTGVDGIYTVATVTDANTFTYTAGTSLTTSGNVTLTRNTVRASGNVSSVADLGVGTYNINFAIAMVDANYAPAAFIGNTTTGTARVIDTAGTTPTIYALRIGNRNSNTGILADDDIVCVSVFR